MITQSGYQSATGGYSEGDGIAQMRAMKEKQTGKRSDDKLDLSDLTDGGMGPKPPGGAKSKKDPDKAPLLWLYLALVVAGAAVPVFLAPARLRGAVVTAFAGLAVLVLVIQLVVGFPLGNVAADASKQMQQALDAGKKAGQGGGMAMDPELAEMMKVKSSYLVSFWLTFALLLASLVLGVLQIVLAGSGGGRPRRAREETMDLPDEDDDG